MRQPSGPSAMTVEQKAALCLGSDFWHTAPVPGHGIEAITVSDGPHGLRAQSGDHVGLSGSTPATCFPTASALGSSWDVDLAREVGAAIGLEAREQGVAVVLGPGVNIKRSPLCGRNFEYLSEDPLLAGHLGAALVEGLQSQNVGASVKHFAANNQETDRLRVSADVDERTLREIYLPAFEHVVTTARPWTVMCAYNKVNGEYASQHRRLLTDVLRGEWGFDGVVMSDWGAVHDRVAALVAGLDLEMPPHLGVSDKAIVDAVADGSLDETVLDRTVGRVLGLVERARARQPGLVDPDAHHALARRAAADCTVLLRNDGDVLPLVDRPGLRVVVVGEFARTPRFQGAGSSQVNPTRVDSALDALRAALPSAEVEFEGDPATADVVLAFLGLPAEAESEGFDRTHIDLPAEQVRRVADLAAHGVPVVAVLANGGVVRTSTWEHHVAAVVECWLGGQAAGSAVADVLTGAVDPGGRLAETIPLTLHDHPSSINFPGAEGHVRYGEGVFVGYRGLDATGREVAYPFGHGLSYTTFAHRDLTVTSTGSHDGGDLALTVEVTVGNTGARPGREVVQLYVGDPESSVARPPRELKGFAKVALAPGEERRVTFTLGPRDLSYWSAEFGRWVLEGGEFEIAVGASSRDLTQRATVTVDATPPHRPLTGMSTLQEWLADPDGSAALIAAVGTGPDGRPRGVLGDAEMLQVLGNFPVGVLAAFPGLGIDAAVLARIGAAG